ncbi:VOC family protein [uncultured Hyphomonas sp.]|uniref:VOC family protein n=1 Tax=uncultured Hyphomonas sp. TaxID=225298 RepID=UPI002AAB3C1B|nr:VOC family protein [uncultured Hyphomonas sp.]
MIRKVSTYLMFTGQAADALALYTDVFPQSESSVRDGPVYMADWRLAGHDVMLVDSPPVHDFTFTPSTSLFVEFEEAAALDAAFAKLSDGGSVMMPLDNYGFSQRFGWVADRFGVSWQLNLP